MIDGDECISQRCWEWVWESGMGVILLVLCTHIPPLRRLEAVSSLSSSAIR